MREPTDLNRRRNYPMNYDQSMIEVNVARAKRETAVAHFFEALAMVIIIATVIAVAYIIGAGLFGIIGAIW